MRVKMGIFIEARDRFNFSGHDHFQVIFKFIFEKNDQK